MASPSSLPKWQLVSTADSQYIAPPALPLGLTWPTLVLAVLALVLCLWFEDAGDRKPIVPVADAVGVLRRARIALWSRWGSVAKEDVDGMMWRLLPPRRSWWSPNSSMKCDLKHRLRLSWLILYLNWDVI
ncbi:unnamed protein product [Victoria cruziana]